MAQYFDSFQFLKHLFSRTRFMLVTTVTAVVLGAIVTVLQTRTYTAVARLVIDAPAGSDARASMVVSPVYLELLRTYELIAYSDDLFLRTAQKFGLDSRVPTERVKRSILRVEVPRNTKILEIRARLPDPRKAHAVALYVAEETVRLTRGTNVEGDEELTANIAKQLAEAQARLDNANAASRQLEVREPVEGLKDRIRSMEDLRARLQQELLAAQLNIADGEDREKVLAQDPSSSGQLVVTREQLRSDRLRMEGLRQQIGGLDLELKNTRERLAERSSRQEEAATERRSAQSALDATANHLREARYLVGFRGERLRIIDPGVIPGKPSSPNVPLEIGAALLMGSMLAILLVSLEFSYRLHKAESLRYERRSEQVNG
jgi:uncharacterized protein involved in exopolysaccharide biosynthesis